MLHNTRTVHLITQHTVFWIHILSSIYPPLQSFPSYFIQTFYFALFSTVMRMANTTTGLSFSVFPVWVLRGGNKTQMNKQFMHNTEMCVYIQDVTGGTDQTSGGCSLC